MLIEVFGPGCAKCRRSVETARAFLRRSGREGEVVKHSDIDAMLDRGILRTPTVLVDGNKIVEGRVLRESDLEAWLGRKAD
jgi:small redox-active disulfide protein 2